MEFLYNTFIFHPIFNLLMLIYAVIPGGDFGVAIIVFTIIIRLLMWPLIKKQLHQTKLQQSIQPQLKEIKQKAAGNREVEASMMMELYKEKGIKPLSSIGIILLQLPIFFALFSTIKVIAEQRDKIAANTYDFLEGIGRIHTIIADPGHHLNQMFLGLIDLSKVAIGHTGTYWPLLVLAALGAALQYFQSKQTMPKPKDAKRLRDIMNDAAEGKQADQADIMAATSRNMLFMFPIMSFMFMIYVPGALALYYVVQSIVAIIQQHILLGKDLEEMEEIAGAKQARAKKYAKKYSSETSVRVLSAKDAEIVEDTLPKTKTAQSSTKTSKKKKGKRR